MIEFEPMEHCRFRVMADVVRNRLYITIGGHLCDDLAVQAAEAVTKEAGLLARDFDVVHDISQARPTNERTLKVFTTMQRWLLDHGMRRVIRVTCLRLSEHQLNRAGKHAGYFPIVVPSLDRAEKLLDAFTMPEGNPSLPAVVNMGAYARRYCRMSVGRDHTVRFSLGHLDCLRVPIANLSADGCFALLPGEYENLVRAGTLLHDFSFEHEDLPTAPFMAKVVRIVPGLSETSDRETGLGIHFLAPPLQTTEWIDAYVMAYVGLEA